MTMDPALDLPAVEYAERSDPGRDPSKQVNEDAAGRRETRFGHLCVVCDGMGGHAAGREAAELALATIFATFEQAPEGASPAGVLRAAIEEASRRVHAMPATEVALGRPGSTVVAVLMHALGTEVGHVGDSRAYLVHEGQISRVTRDHSIVQEMVDRGLITLQQATTHPDANRITRALGMAPEIEAEVRPQPVLHVTGDAFVLCSDGLSDLVEDQEILDTVGNAPAVQAVGKLVDLANARGGHDNITVLVLRARSSAFVSSTGVAPTVAQTHVTQAHAPVQSGATVVEPRFDPAPVPPRFDPAVGERRFDPATGEPLFDPATAERQTDVPRVTAPLEPTLPPPSPRPPSRARTRRVGPALVAGLTLASIAVAVLAAVLAVHFVERGGAHDPSSEASARPAPSAESIDAGRAPPTPLVPDSVQIPAPSAAPAETIAPLEPAPGPDRVPHKKRKH